MFAFLGMIDVKTWIIIGLVAALGAFGLYHKGEVALLNHTISDLREDVAKKDSTIASQKVQITDLTSAIDKQNKAVQDLADASAKASAAATAAIAKAKADAKKWEEKYQGVLNGPRPDGTDCEALNLKLDQYMTIRQQEEENAQSPPK